MSITLGIFGAILLVTLAITYWAAKRTRTASSFYTADKGLSAPQNGFAHRLRNLAARIEGRTNAKRRMAPSCVLMCPKAVLCRSLSFTL